MSTCNFCEKELPRDEKGRLTRHVCPKSGPLHYAARAKYMAPAPPGWRARIAGKDWPVAMFCRVYWYDGGDHEDEATLACYDGRMVLAEQTAGFDRILAPGES